MLYIHKPHGVIKMKKLQYFLLFAMLGISTTASAGKTLYQTLAEQNQSTSTFKPINPADNKPSGSKRQKPSTPVESPSSSRSSSPSQEINAKMNQASASTLIGSASNFLHQAEKSNDLRRKTSLQNLAIKHFKCALTKKLDPSMYVIVHCTLGNIYKQQYNSYRDQNDFDKTIKHLKNVVIYYRSKANVNYDTRTKKCLDHSYYAAMGQLTELYLLHKNKIPIALQYLKALAEQNIDSMGKQWAQKALNSDQLSSNAQHTPIDQGYIEKNKKHVLQQLKDKHTKDYQAPTRQKLKNVLQELQNKHCKDKGTA